MTDWSTKFFMTDPPTPGNFCYEPTGKARRSYGCVPLSKGLCTLNDEISCPVNSKHRHTETFLNSDQSHKVYIEPMMTGRRGSKLQSFSVMMHAINNRLLLHLLSGHTQTIRDHGTQFFCGFIYTHSSLRTPSLRRTTILN